MDKVWRLYSRAPNDFLQEFAEYSIPILQILWNRDIKTRKEIEEFFHPDYQKLLDIFLMKNVKRAVKEIIKAIKERKKIGIFTDFDVDGITGAAILIETFIALGHSEDLIFLYIPDREKEGYGVNEKGVKFLDEAGSEIFIAIDCGVSNREELRLAKKLGMKTIIIDHHEVPKNPSKADIFVDPLQAEDKYPFKELAAAGIVFKIAQAILKETKNEEIEKQLLDLVCLATIADCCPLIGENRILVKHGLIALQNTKRVGLQEIIRIARINAGDLDVEAVARKLSPILNSASRMDHANTAYKLITTDSIWESANLAKKLEEKNRERQTLTREILEELETRISKYKVLPGVIFEGAKNWPLTLSGPLAAKTLEKYWRPVLIFNIGEKESRGSSRSIPGLNMVKVLEKCSKHLLKWGGHPLAAGYTFLNENQEDLKACLNQVVRDLVEEEIFSSVLEIDVRLSPEDLNFKLYEEILKLTPIGIKNPKPKFLMENLKIERIEMFGRNGNGKHLKLKLTPVNYKFIPPYKAIGFNAAERMREFREKDIINLVFELDVDEWQGQRELLLKIVDFKTSG